MNLPLVLLMTVALAVASPAWSLAQSPGSASLQQLAGEDRLYALDFLFFTRLAEGHLRLDETETPGVFRAELVGRTLGVASWLTGERTQTYTSLMKLVPGGALRSIEHMSRIVKKRWGKWQHREHHYRYDYTRGMVFDRRVKDGSVRPEDSHDMPEGQQPVDMLTAFYNLRIGAYGMLTHGSRLLIPTYSGGKFTDIEVEVLAAAQQSQHSYFPAHGLLMQVRIDPEVFDTRSGSLYLWFDDAGVPARGIVEDLIGLGDVRGYLATEAL